MKLERIKVSIIMPVYLAKYSGAASSREMKFIRAVHSFLDNTYQNKECRKVLQVKLIYFDDTMDKVDFLIDP